MWNSQNVKLERKCGVGVGATPAHNEFKQVYILVIPSPINFALIKVPKGHSYGELDQPILQYNYRSVTNAGCHNNFTSRIGLTSFCGLDHEVVICTAILVLGVSLGWN